jgi:hypothetical protein
MPKKKNKTKTVKKNKKQGEIEGYYFDGTKSQVLIKKRSILSI